MVAGGITSETGSAGVQVSYAYDSHTGTLTLFGSGETNLWSAYTPPPWKGTSTPVKKLVVKEGVTFLGDYACFQQEELTEISLPQTLKYLGACAFFQCTHLKTVVLPEGLEVIGAKAFSKCSALRAVFLPSTITHIDMKAFDADGLLEHVFYNGTPGGWEQIAVSRSAQGNRPLMSSNLHFLKSPQCFSDLPAHTALADAVEYLTERNYWVCREKFFDAQAPASRETLFSVLYRQAGKPANFSSATDWAARSGLTKGCQSSDLSWEDAVCLLYRAAQKNGRAPWRGNGFHPALNWYRAQKYPEFPKPVLSRGELALILSAYLHSGVSLANRTRFQDILLQKAIENGGDGRLHLYFPDISTPNAAGKPGDCALLVFPNGVKMLIDTAVKTSSHILIDMLQKYGICTLDYLVVSHPHQDHIGGALDVISYLKQSGGCVGELWRADADCKQYLKIISDALGSNTKVRMLHQGMALQIGGVSVSILNPSAQKIAQLKENAFLEEEDGNNISLSIKFTYGRSTYLTCGDLYANQEQVLLRQYGAKLQADIVKANHHGAYTSNSEAWLHSVNPSAIFVESDDIGNTYLSKMAASNNTAFFTMGFNGSTLISMDAKRNYHIITQKDSAFHENWSGSRKAKQTILTVNKIDM